VEHALDLQGRQRVLFVDASAAPDAPPCTLTRIEPLKDSSFSTHAMSAAAVMQVYVELEDDDPPPCWQLAIRGERFELGEPLTDAAGNHLQAALVMAADWLSHSPAQ
jgi:hydrogenase maturation protease